MQRREKVKQRKPFYKYRANCGRHFFRHPLIFQIVCGGRLQLKSDLQLTAFNVYSCRGFNTPTLAGNYVANSIEIC